MISSEETNDILNRMAENRPRHFFSKVDSTNAGIKCVIKFLVEADRSVSAGEISSYMNVSTARVAVLLKKMSEKGLIVKERDPCDARKTIITISAAGKEIDRKCREEIIRLFTSVIEKVGKEKFEEFIDISGEIKKAIAEEIDAQGFQSFPEKS